MRVSASMEARRVSHKSAAIAASDGPTQAGKRASGPRAHRAPWAHGALGPHGPPGAPGGPLGPPGPPGPHPEGGRCTTWCKLVVLPSHPRALSCTSRETGIGSKISGLDLAIYGLSRLREVSGWKRSALLYRNFHGVGGKPWHERSKKNKPVVGSGSFAQI